MLRLFVRFTTAALLLAMPLSSLAFNFDWNSIGWNNGQTSPQTFNNVNGSGVDITIETVGDTGTLTNNTPGLYSVGGNNELRLFPNFANTSQSVTTRFTFSRAVSIENLIIKDIDSQAWSDGVRVEGFIGIFSVDPTVVTLGSGVVQTQAGPTEFDADQAGRGWSYNDPRGWATSDFNTGVLIDALEITHFSGQWAPSNPSGQAITISDFQFFPAATGSDSSDAPSSYGQATHPIDPVPTVYIGTVPPDADPVDRASASANGDDINDFDDEDGVTFTSLDDGSSTIEAHVTVTKPQAVSRVRVCGWLDTIDGSADEGSFQRSEGRCQELADLTAGTNVVTLSWSGLPNSGAYNTYARFRVTTQGMGRGRSTGARSDGEVEDYEISVNFDGPGPSLVTIGRVELADAQVDEVLEELGADDMDRDQLHVMALGWQPELGEQLSDADSDTLRQALVRHLDPDGDGTVAVMRWDTLEERGTIGFYAERRQPGGSWSRINDTLLPGLITAPMGGEYQLVDPGVQTGIPYEYRLVEVEARGSTRTYGPYTLQLD